MSENYTINPGKVKINPMKSIVSVIVILFVIMFLFGSIVSVPAGHRGVVFNRLSGIDQTPLSEGLHFKVPLIESVTKYETRTQKIEVDSSSASKDLQIVTSVIALNFHVEPSTVPILFQEVGVEYASRIILPAIQESVKSVTATFNAEELITKRPQVSLEMKEILKERLQENGIVVDEFSIIDFAFSPEFDAAIEAKQVAEQRALQAERDLDRIKIEKEQKITQAEAEAESLRIQSAALRDNKDILQLRAIEKWNGVLPRVTGDTMPFIDVSSIGGLDEN